MMISSSVMMGEEHGGSNCLFLEIYRDLRDDLYNYMVDCYMLIVVIIFNCKIHSLF